jgi:hypothetical protein
VLRKLGFTGTIAVLDGILLLSTSNTTFSHKLNTDSESAEKTESNGVSFDQINQLSFFAIFSDIVRELKLLSMGQKMKVIKLARKILHLTQFFLLIQNLHLVFEEKSYLKSKIAEYRLKWQWFQ